MAIDQGLIRRGTVLAIEATDRLFRENMFDAFDLLKRLIVTGGMVIITGDLTEWDVASINSNLAHKLVAELNAARAYSERLSDYATGAHRRSGWRWKPWRAIQAPPNRCFTVDLRPGSPRSGQSMR